MKGFSHPRLNYKAFVSAALVYRMEEELGNPRGEIDESEVFVVSLSQVSDGVDGALLVNGVFTVGEYEESEEDQNRTYVWDPKTERILSMTITSQKKNEKE